MPADVLRLSQPRAVTLLAISALLCCSAAVAGLSEGYEALIRKDYATAIKEYRPLAERGNAEAQYRIGRMYEFGQGYRQDKAQGIAWIRKAAAQNHADAQQELGFIYASGDGVRRDDVQAVAWFRKAAEQGNPTAQYNLGLLYAKGQGVKTDYAEAAAWWRKAAAQGNADAQLKLAVVYHTGQGAARDDVLALADATIAARDGDKENVDYRDEIAKPLTPEQRRRAQAWAEAWKIGQPMPGSAATPGSSASPTATAGRPVKTRCSASGTMGGEKFSAANCVASLYGDQHSVAIWFNEDPITPAEAESFQLSSYAEGAKGGKQRTMAIIALSGRRQGDGLRGGHQIDRPQHQSREVADGGHPTRGRGAEGLQSREDDGRRQARRHAVGQDRRQPREDGVRVRLRLELAGQGCRGGDELPVAGGAAPRALPIGFVREFRPRYRFSPCGCPSVLSLCFSR